MAHMFKLLPLPEAILVSLVLLLPLWLGAIWFISVFRRRFTPWELFAIVISGIPASCWIFYVLTT
jgi:hypothetical protein